MKAALRLKYALILAACVWQAFFFPSALSGQVQPSTGQQAQSAQPEKTEDAISENRPGGPNSYVLNEYEAFAGLLHQEYLENQKALSDGEEPRDYSWSWSGGFREDEEQAVWTLTLDFWNRNSEWWDHCLPIRKKYAVRHRGDPPPGDDLKPCLDEARNTMDREFILRLKQALGEEDFRRLDKDSVRWHDSLPPTRKPEVIEPPAANSGTTTIPEVQK